MTIEYKKDFLFRALANMGNASGTIAWANTCVEDIEDVPDEVKARMNRINVQIHELQEELRTIREALTQ